MQQDMILIIDLGSTENARLARLIRRVGVYSEIHPHDLDEKALAAIPNVKGIIFNGGENRIVDGVEVKPSAAILAAGVPTLSIDCDGAPALSADDDAVIEMLKPFIFDTCAADANWNIENFIADQVELIRRQVGDGRVLLALSGGVDSSVVAALLIRAIGDRLTCVHVNHGLLRQGEPEEVVQVFGKELGADLIYVDAVDRYLDKLAGVADPERKRKIIGEEFIRIFEEEARRLSSEGVKFLAQGTIYPDIIESGTKTAKNVKSHHNVGGLPEDLKFELVEPLKMLFKDEVRACGAALGLPDNMVNRQPFPGPGLGVRCLGAITRDRLEAVRHSDAILREEFAKEGLVGKVWQYFTAIPDMKSVGVRNHARSTEWAVVIRAVNTVDAMTATAAPLDFAFLQRVTERIVNEVKGVNRVLYDLSPKPFSTIEWE